MREQEIRVLEQKIMERIDQEVLQRKELEGKIMKLIDAKAAGLRTEIAKEGKIRFESLENLEQCLEVTTFFYP